MAHVTEAAREEGGEGASVEMGKMLVRETARRTR